MKKLMAMLPMMALVIVCAMLLSASRKPVTIYLCGDGTMANHDTTVTHERGWGQVLPTFLTKKAIVKNYAKVGSSSTSFLHDGTWEDVRKKLQSGDILILQFGNNDANKADSTLYASIIDFEHNLIHIVKEAEKENVKVVLCTPVVRPVYSLHTNQWVDTHGAYPEAIRRVSTSQKVPLIDMTILTSQWLHTFTDNATALSYFNNMFLNEQGALAVAKIFAKQVKSLEIKFLSSAIVTKKPTIKYAPSSAESVK